VQIFSWRGSTARDDTLSAPEDEPTCGSPMTIFLPFCGSSKLRVDAAKHDKLRSSGRPDQATPFAFFRGSGQMATGIGTKPMICRGCWEQMRVPVPIRGPLAAPFRLFGIKRSNMNPDLCTVCELMFSKIMRKRNIEVDLTIMFADLRGYTALTEEIDRERMREILDFFYDECAEAIWAADGLLNKTLGDGVMAVFNFPLARADHARRAVEAARQIQRRCSERVTASAGSTLPHGLAVGIGLHAGLTSFGEFGRVHRDLTAVGSVVNLAARFQSAAAAGEIVVSREVLGRLGGEREARGQRDYSLKGFAEPVTAFLM
jgi:adenylate cyclase